MTHSDLAALRGEPSYVWRAGQERRLGMIATWARLDGAKVLDCVAGVGMYASQIQRRYQAQVELFDIELDRMLEARSESSHATVADNQHMPYPSNYFDTLISNEVLEHVTDDRAAMVEMIRVLKPGGRAVIFVPNRWYPFETHGHYRNGEYHFGNTPLINYLPDRWRNQLAPHVRAYTRRGLLRLIEGLQVSITHHERIYGGYDNLIARLGKPMQVARDILYKFEDTPLDTWGLSHLLVIEKD